MPISDELFLSILTMDSYNRGYGSGVWANSEIGTQTDGLGSNLKTQIGAATISYNLGQVSDVFEAESQLEGFYAIAYDVGDETVIAYRGTDAVGDFGTGPSNINELLLTDAAMIVYDDFDEPQFHLASQFYSSVALTKDTITTTGSLSVVKSRMFGSVSSGSVVLYEVRDNLPPDGVRG